MTLRTVLLIEDMPSLQVLYKTILKRDGFDVHVAETAAEGAEMVRSVSPDIVLLDLLLPDGDGLSILDLLADLEHPSRAIVITAHGSVNRAVAAMRAGAFDFLVKPFDDTRLRSAVSNAQKDLRTASPTQRVRAINNLGLEGFVGNSAVMRDLYARVDRVAPSMAPVLVTGDTGTGKAMCARALHALSNRADAPFVSINCSADNPVALQARLFGDGGATAALAEADGGTLVLTDIGAMDLATQTRFLNFLQSSRLNDEADRLDVRIVCTATDSPQKAMDAGAFREDLFYRLNVVPLHLPPLRMRGDDAIAIAQDALTRFASEQGKTFSGLSPDVKRVFAGHAWPGNVRQLLNLLRSTVLLQEGGRIELSMLPREFLQVRRDAGGGQEAAGSAQLRGAQPVSSVGSADDTQQAIDVLSQSDQSFAQIERKLIEAVIARNNRSVPAAARQLGLSPSTIYRKLDAWDKVDSLDE